MQQLTSNGDFGIWIKTYYKHKTKWPSHTSCQAKDAIMLEIHKHKEEKLQVN